MGKKKLLLKGIAASTGTATGKVRLFGSGGKPESFHKGDVLVATITDPTMAAAMVKAAAIITDIGGMTSHPAILSREMGIPCVVNTKTATTVLKNGVKVFVDGGKGEVYALD